MKGITGSRIAIAVGLGAFAVATWFASRPPETPSLPPAVVAVSTSTVTSSSSITPSSANHPASALSSSSIPAAKASTQPPTAAPAAKPIVITVTSPTSGAEWTIGTENTISWNKPAGVPGQMYLVNDVTGAIAGWILQTVAPGQTYFPWSTRDLSVSETNPAGENVVPGKYVIKMSFSSRQVPSVTSAPFTIVAAPVQPPK